MDDTRLGTILLEHRIIQEPDLERCLDIQALTGGGKPLGQILIEQEIISADTLESLLRFQEARRRRAQAADVQVENGSSESILYAAVNAGANEVVVSEGRQVLIRVAGHLRNLSPKAVASPDVWQFVRDQMGPEVLDQLADRKSVTRDFHKPEMGRGRITAFRHFDGVAVIVRLHPEAVRSPEEAGIDGRVLEILQSGKGLVLLTAEIRSGLTETMASLLAEVVKVPSRYILVLDDNLEYLSPESKSVVVRRRVGEHARDYVSALRAAIREEPDAILCGDISEPEVFDLAMRAAERGTLVIGAVHTASVVGALHRVLNFYPTYDVQRVRTTLASVLRCVLALHLLPDADCVGQVLAGELLLMDDAAQDIVRNGKLSSLNLLLGMEGTTSGYSLDHSLLSLLRDGQARFDDVFNYAQDKAKILQHASTVRS
jgi:twitching motility protein PilT